jgi:hypothetical protein
MTDTLTRWNVHFVADYHITTVTVFAEDGADAESKAMDAVISDDLLPMDISNFRIEAELA